MLEVSRLGGEKSEKFLRRNHHAAGTMELFHAWLAQAHLMADLPRMTGSKLQHSVLERYKAPFWIWTTPVVKCVDFFHGPPKRISNQRNFEIKLFPFFFPTKIRPGSPSSFHTWSGHADDDALYGLGCRHRAIRGTRQEIWGPPTCTCSPWLLLQERCGTSALSHEASRDFPEWSLAASCHLALTLRRLLVICGCSEIFDDVSKGSKFSLISLQVQSRVFSYYKSWKVSLWMKIEVLA